MNSPPDQTFGMLKPLDKFGKIVINIFCLCLMYPYICEDSQ